MQQTRSPIPLLIAVILVAMTLRIVVLASNSVSFHSDEAIVGLMARHINNGEAIPTFFYGQPYMGSLDAILVSVAFRIFGERVLSIRIVESLLYLCLVATTFWLAYRLSHDIWVATFAALLIAVPPVVLTTYTTLSLGGYGEVLVLGNLLLIIAYEITGKGDPIGSSYEKYGFLKWAALGAVTGLGWWTNALIIVYAVPVAILLLLNIRHLKIPGIVIAGVAFLIFSAPWWLYNLNHDWEALHFLTGGFGSSASLSDKALGFFLLGIPAIVGVRFPWADSVWNVPFSAAVITLYGVILLTSVYILIRFRRGSPLLWIMVIGFVAIFLLSGFGIDATGRYLLPLIIPVCILVGWQIRLWQRQSRALKLIPSLLLVILLGVNLYGTALAIAQTPPGLTPQFDPTTDFPNDHDQALIDFLLQNGGNCGYGTYWAAYRIDFLAGERVILSPLLPDKPPFADGGPDRYPLYTQQVEASCPIPVLVTANLPTIDQRILASLHDLNVEFKQKSIGIFTVFYNLSRRVTPDELHLQD